MLTLIYLILTQLFLIAGEHGQDVVSVPPWLSQQLKCHQGTPKLPDILVVNFQYTSGRLLGQWKPQMVACYIEITHGVYFCN